MGRTRDNIEIARRVANGVGEGEKGDEKLIAAFRAPACHEPFEELIDAKEGEDHNVPA